jgi:hypothetical protein
VSTREIVIHWLRALNKLSLAASQSSSIEVMMWPRYRKLVSVSIGWFWMVKMRRKARMHCKSRIFCLLSFVPCLQIFVSVCRPASCSRVQNMPHCVHLESLPSSMIIIVSWKWRNRKCRRIPKRFLITALHPGTGHCATSLKWDMLIVYVLPSAVDRCGGVSCCVTNDVSSPCLIRLCRLKLRACTRALHMSHSTCCRFRSL